MAVNFSGLNQVSQPTTMKKVQKAEVAFTAKPQVDTVSFGMAGKAKAAAEVVEKVSKLGAVKAVLGKISAPVVKAAKAILAIVAKCFKALNPMPLLQKLSGLFSKGAAKAKDVATHGAEVAKNLINKAPKG